MFELTGRILSVSFDYQTGKPIITFEINEKQAALKMVDGLKRFGKLAIKVAQFRQKRSRDANAYFHLLVNKIAEATDQSDDAVKRDLVTSYGTLARDENGDLIGAMFPASVDPDRFYPYTRSYKTEYRDGKAYTCYLFYERTRYLDTAQMAHLIEGTVAEAKALGIETKPKEELESLLRQRR